MSEKNEKRMYIYSAAFTFTQGSLPYDYVPSIEDFGARTHGGALYPLELSVLAKGMAEAGWDIILDRDKKGNHYPIPEHLRHLFSEFDEGVKER